MILHLAQMLQRYDTHEPQKGKEASSPAHWKHMHRAASAIGHNNQGTKPPTLSLRTYGRTICLPQNRQKGAIR